MAPLVARLSGTPSDPLEFWRRLHPRPRRGFFLGPPFAGAGGRLYFSCAEPVRAFVCRSGRPRDVLNRLSASSGGPAAGFPRFVGFLSFPSGRLFEPALRRLPLKRDSLEVPWQAFGDFPAVAALDAAVNEIRFAFHPAWPAARRNRVLARAAALLRSDPVAAAPSTDHRRAHGPFRSVPPRRFAAWVRAAKERIREGDIYQANLSVRFSRAFRADPAAYYRLLCGRNPSPYACLLTWDAAWLASCSPELLLRVEDGRVVTRPIAGTRPRGRTARQDRLRRGRLLLSPKERAEHIMLVDLERNDLGRVCAPGSVRVTGRFEVERYSHVMHIVSQVEGRLKRGVSSRDALRAVFPGGTITGCPKIKAVEVIESLEPVSRGPFYGSAGYFAWNGDAVFNILIRSAWIQNGAISIQAGAGIVADSDPAREYRESAAKAAALLETAAVA